MALTDTTDTKAAEPNAEPDKPNKSDSNKSQSDSNKSQSETEIALIEKPAPTARALRNARLRAAAAMAYISSATGITVEELHEDLRFKKVKLSTLRAWSGRDRWTEQRASFIERWTKMAKERLGSRMAQERIQTLDHLGKIKDQAMEKITSDLIKPRSYEGLVKATLSVMQFEDELRSKIGADVLDQTAADIQAPNVAPPETPAPAITTVEATPEPEPTPEVPQLPSGLPIEETPPDMTHEELEAAAAAVLANRRDKMRAAMAAEEKAKKEKAKREKQLKEEAK